MPQPDSQIPLKMHPRVFAALGADLVTSDVVAVIELVKNAYDALAKEVWVRFLSEAEEEEPTILEIHDDGHGMTREVIETVWSTVATPFRTRNTMVEGNGLKRRVSGEKGLGRLSVGRLGKRLTMYTRAKDHPCWKVTVDWDGLADASELESSFISCVEADEDIPESLSEAGTVLIIDRLNSEWTTDLIEELEDNLARLQSPVARSEDFKIFLSTSETPEKSEHSEIKAHPFLSKPKYLITGSVSPKGEIKYKYVFRPLKGSLRRASGSISWDQIKSEHNKSAKKTKLTAEAPECGPFSFEIRAWDLAAGDTDELAVAYDIKKSQIRKAIGAHKGLSVYRDGILVLPKSETAKDWLGLDLRRVSRVGTRISTSQIVGHIGIGADDNPMISDTSDRERFVQNAAYKHFEILLFGVVGMLENLRNEDREVAPSESLTSLFDDLFPDEELTEQLSEAGRAGDTQRVIALLEAYTDKSKKVASKIKQRFTYYSHLATIGGIAETLIHEIRSRTGVIDRFLRKVPKKCIDSPNLEQALHSARQAVNSLERLANTFSPLANTGFKRGRRVSNLHERINQCLEYQRESIQHQKVEIRVPDELEGVVINADPAELDAIVLNLLTNALYWVKTEKNPRIEFEFEVDTDEDRIKVSVHDNGPGIEEGDVEKVFLPGVTRKPHGIGMGLTVAGELVEAYGGKLGAAGKGKLGGASFEFDLPVKS